MTMLSTDRWLMAAGLLYKGYSVNEKDPAKIEEAKNALIEAKKTLLAYDDTTFFSKLVSGEASLVQAWDGWCNYGIAENDKIKFVVPKEGSDLWVDTMVVMKNSEHKEAAMKFVDFILDAKNHAWAASNIFYEVPNKPAMESLDPALIKKYPTMGVSPAELVKYEELQDLGEAQTRLFARRERDQGGELSPLSFSPQRGEGARRARAEGACRETPSCPHRSALLPAGETSAAPRQASRGGHSIPESISCPRRRLVPICMALPAIAWLGPVHGRAVPDHSCLCVPDARTLWRYRIHVDGRRIFNASSIRSTRRSF